MRRGGLVLLVIALLAAVACQPVKKSTPQPWIPNHPGLPRAILDGPPPADSPTLSAPEIVVGQLSTPWDIAFGPDGEMFFDERRGFVKVLLPGSGPPIEVLRPDDVFETDVFFGLLGLDVHPQFETNRFLYVCYTTLDDVRVVRWRVNDAFNGATNATPIVTGIPAAIAPNLGCRVKFGPDGDLWVTTGDIHDPGVPQDRGSLGGKFLRVPNGEPWGGNPADLVFSYGHRNPQGIAFQPGSGTPYGIEHGTNRDDEVNRLVVAGSNGGWDPQPPPYNENVPMTDLVKFPNAMLPVWRSGDAGPPPNSATIAPSGGTFLDHAIWGEWNGALAVATLKGRHLRVMFLDANGVVEATTSVLREYNTRLRTVVQGPDGNLYVATDAAPNGAIWKITPSPPP